MNSKFYFLSLLLLVLFSAQTSFAIEPTVEELRSMGPAGLQALMTRYAGEINRYIANPSPRLTKNGNESQPRSTPSHSRRTVTFPVFIGTLISKCEARRTCQWKADSVVTPVRKADR